MKIASLPRRGWMGSSCATASSRLLALGTGPGGAVADQVRKGEASIIGEGNADWSFVHIDDAVAATVASLTAEQGVYNIVDDDPLPVAEWLPAFARWVDAPEPPRVSVEDALRAAGAEAVYFHTRLTGAANSRAKAQLGFTPRPLLWKPHLAIRS
jgi:nucleoside-diphosphate-sugar epimerase